MQCLCIWHSICFSQCMPMPPRYKLPRPLPPRCTRSAAVATWPPQIHVFCVLVICDAYTVNPDSDCSYCLSFRQLSLLAISYIFSPELMWYPDIPGFLYSTQSICVLSFRTHEFIILISTVLAFPGLMLPSLDNIPIYINIVENSLNLSWHYHLVFGCYYSFSR